MFIFFILLPYKEIKICACVMDMVVTVLLNYYNYGSALLTSIMLSYAAQLYRVTPEFLLKIFPLTNFR